MSERETPGGDALATNDVDTGDASCHNVAVPESVIRSDERDERPLESFFHALQHGNDHSPGLNPSDFAAIIRRDRDLSS